MQTRANAVKGDISFPWQTHLTREQTRAPWEWEAWPDLCLKKKLNVAWTQDGLALPMLVSESY